MIPHMTFAEQVKAAKAQSPHWTPKMRKHLRRLMRRQEKKGDVVFAIWLSDAHGRPANHDLASLDDRQFWTARPGLVQNVAGPLKECSDRALHATWDPHQWAGCRAWLVAMVGKSAVLENKIAGICRHIIGEIMPENALSDSLGVRLGLRDLQGANLRGANLRGADLQIANLRGANLHHADLRRADLRDANLQRADLYGADLYGADMRGANLQRADLYGADLHGADLRGANLQRADLYGADLHSADLQIANLRGANLRGANLHHADLRRANLHGADLYGADMRGADLILPSGYKLNASGIAELAP